jgi:hypothetical protein
VLKAKSNVDKLIKTLGRFETAKRFAAHETLRKTSSYAGHESAKSVRASKYSTAPLRYLRNRIDWRKQGGREQPLGRQASTTVIRANEISVMYMRARNVRVQTKAGRRWAVTVPVVGNVKERETVQGAFHLKSTGQRKLRGAGGEPFTKESVLFKRGKGEALVRHRFRTVAEVMEQGGYTQRVVNKAEARIAKLMARNIARHLRQINLSIG